MATCMKKRGTTAIWPKGSGVCDVVKHHMRAGDGNRTRVASLATAPK